VPIQAHLTAIDGELAQRTGQQLARTVLVRRVKQGVAEWYRLQLKENHGKDSKNTFSPGGIQAPPLRVRR
jgi:hypothetical protein